MESDLLKSFPKNLPAQKQGKQPGIEGIMNPRPVFENPGYKTSGKLCGKVALITGGDSGIGRAAATAFALEGADVAIIYYNEHDDANEIKNIIDKKGKKCMLVSGDIGDESFCKSAANKIVNELGKIDILVNNAAEQHMQYSIEDITAEQLEKTFRTNVFGMFYMTKHVLPYLKEGSCIINTASITAYKGNELLIDYSSSKGAVVSFTRSLALSLIPKKIRVNAVAPWPVWTPLIPASFSEYDVSKFGTDNPMGRAAQPVELAGAYLYLASECSSYVTGQTIHVNGGEIVNG